jgi:hypothetical protein
MLIICSLPLFYAMANKPVEESNNIFRKILKRKKEKEKRN